MDSIELGEIASDPDKDNVFAAANFTSLNSVRDGIKKALCNGQYLACALSFRTGTVKCL